MNNWLAPYLFHILGVPIIFSPIVVQCAVHGALYTVCTLYINIDSLNHLLNSAQIKEIFQ